MVLLPVDLEEEIEPDYLVRVVNAAMEKMDLSVLLSVYPRGGSSSYPLKLLLKVLIYAYRQFFCLFSLTFFKPKRLSEFHFSDSPFFNFASYSRPWGGVGVGEISRQNIEIHPNIQGSLTHPID
jgi:hypothetical protein